MAPLTDVPTPTEDIHLQVHKTGLDIDGTSYGDGTLFITENYVIWKQTEGKGITLQYPSICCHAISRDVCSFPLECLYLMVDGKLPGHSSDDASDDDEDDDCDDSPSDITEVRISPEDKNMLDAMYTAVSDCQALHPDPEDADSEEEAFADIDRGEEDQDWDISQENQGGDGEAMADAPSQLASFSSALQLGQGDGAGSMAFPGPNGHHSVNGAGDAQQDRVEDMDMEQFEDADDGTGI